MIEFSVAPPKVPIPFHRPLKVVAIVEGQEPRSREFLDHIAAEHFHSESYIDLGQQTPAFYAVPE